MGKSKEEVTEGERPARPETIMRKPIILFDIDYTIFDTDKFKESGLQIYGRYKEDEDILERLSRVADLGIFSQGEIAFQRDKLDKTDVQRFFNQDDIHIHVDKLKAIKEVLERYKGRKVFLVDDRLDVLAQVKATDPEVLTIWIKRGKYAISENGKPDFHPDSTINNLLELLPIMGA